ncbi:HAD hydrolase-like protein [Lacticaseibacillus kribbianus]|uniref:HAD hydrolase-like protein n=1 Tax=Lacticaseibacillus kribbianus TaxID=2926292 RepID=UPI001CD56463|nr:HAD hydrolase-like protein [Lacticaseibacillus kribbianus]
MLTNAIWDLDGTLYDTYPSILSALHETLTKHGVTVDPTALLVTTKKTSVHAVIEDYARQLGWDAKAIFAEYHDVEVKRVLSCQPYPEARATLEAVVAASGRNFLMTHRDDSAWTLLQNSGLRDLFTGGVTSTAKLARKPKPDAVLYIVDRWQLDPAVTAMIGDRSLDIVAGQAAGVQGIYFDVDGLADAPMADHHVDHLHEIPALFGR